MDSLLEPEKVLFRDLLCWPGTDTDPMKENKREVAEVVHS